MKKNYSHVSICLDESGSMDTILNDTIGGFNSFLSEQRNDTQIEKTISLYKFNTNFNTIYENILLSKDNPKNLDNKTFIPKGGTALYDAILKTVNLTGKFLSDKKEEDRPDNVFIIIITDGEENSSPKEITFEKVKETIKHQKEKYNWNFVFIGAELNSVESAVKMGIGRNSTLHFSANDCGTKGVFSSLSRNVTRMSSENSRGLSDFFEECDRDLQDQARKI